LAQSLAECGDELARHSTSSFSFTVHGSPKALSANVLDEAYRIGREALRNAFSHSGASKIETEISFEPREFRLRVRDNGSGIDPKVLIDGRPGHWGLSGMRERAQTLGATFNIWSSSGAGTEVELTVPAKVAYPNVPKATRWRKVLEAVYGGRLRT
jgi:signal transduction histidine kinase